MNEVDWLSWEKMAFIHWGPHYRNTYYILLMPEIVIDQGVKCLNKDIFPHIKTVLDSLNPARSVCKPS